MADKLTSAANVMTTASLTAGGTSVAANQLGFVDEYGQLIGLIISGLSFISALTFMLMREIRDRRKEKQDITDQIAAAVKKARDEQSLDLEKTLRAQGLNEAARTILKKRE